MAGLSFAGTLVPLLPDKCTLTIISRARQSAGYRVF